MSLSPATIRRLKRLPQVPNVWEGARISLPLPIGGEAAPHMVIWMDGSEGTARSLETADESFGHEALVRGLIKAIEHPQGPYPQIRPKKVLVSDREEQFYLRGVLSDLDIAVEYAPELPMVEHLFSRFEEFNQNRQPDLPLVYDQLLRAAADELWQAAPWSILEDYQVIQIGVNCWDVDNFYATVLGMMGQEYGVLLYRSIDSLRQFRLAACSNTGLEEMEKVFLAQDCIFCTFDIEADIPHLGRPQMTKFDDVSYGSIHPLEGMRAVLDEEEVLATYAALIALKRFFEKNKAKLAKDELAAITQKIKIIIPETVPSDPKSVSVTVTTIPELMRELREMGDDDDDDEELDIQDDLIPEHALISTGAVSWELLNSLKQVVPNFDVNVNRFDTEGLLPVMMVQTTKLKAHAMLKFIAAAGGIRGIAFETIEGAPVQLGILALADGQLQLVGEFAHRQVEMWEARCDESKSRCAFLIAQGATKKSKPSPPRDQDIVAVMETRLTDMDVLYDLLDEN
jgi:hypothetical protein